MAVPTIYAKLIETFNKEQMDRDSIETACKAIRYMCEMTLDLGGCLWFDIAWLNTECPRCLVQFTLYIQFKKDLLHMQYL